MNNSIDLTICIVSYNTLELTRRCLQSVRKSLKGSGIRTETIVIDNASKDGSRTMLTREFPDVETVLNRKNLGFGVANNRIIERARGEYILLLNSDTVVIDDAIERLFAFAQRHPRSFIGAKLFNKDGSVQPSAGHFFTLPVIFAILFLRGDRWGATRFSPRRTCRVDWVSGACIMAPKKAFLDDLLFDEKIFLYMEEIDLLFRAAKRDYSVWFFPHAHIFHEGSASSGGRKQPILNIYRGLIYFYTKHYSNKALGILKIMLRLKAILGWSVGFVIGNRKLQETYEEAYRLV